MTALRIQKQVYTAQEYLDFDEETEYRNEFYRGEIFAMSGGSANHNRITVSLAASLSNKLEGKPCETFVSDMRVLVRRKEMYTYPDVTVVCGPLKFARSRTDTIINPMVIFEVLSPSTEDYDRTKKFEFYRAIKSLTDYILVDQSRIHVEHYQKNTARNWSWTILNDAEDVLSLPSISVDIPLGVIYQRVVWEDENEL